MSKKKRMLRQQKQLAKSMLKKYEEYIAWTEEKLDGVARDSEEALQYSESLEKLERASGLLKRGISNTGDGRAGFNSATLKTIKSSLTDSMYNSLNGEGAYGDAMMMFDEFEALTSDDAPTVDDAINVNNTVAPPRREPTLMNEDNQIGSMAVSNDVSESASSDEASDIELPVSREMTTGDKIGLIAGGLGNLAQIGTTIFDRLSDTKNVSKFKEYGEKAMKMFEDQKMTLGKIKANKERDLILSTNKTRSALRNSARGVNALRAGELASSMQEGIQRRGIENDYYANLGNIMNQETQMSFRQDEIRMGAEDRADIANRQDKGSFASSLSSNFNDISKYFQMYGKNKNQMLQDEESLAAISEMNKYGYKWNSETKSFEPK